MSTAHFSKILEQILGVNLATSIERGYQVNYWIFAGLLEIFV